MELTDADLERFWSKVDKQDDCWLWTSTTRTGYGIFALRVNGKRKTVSAHRLSYEIAYGPITSRVVRHKCDNPPCVRPEHLEQGSDKQNSDDKMDRDRHHSLLRNSQVLDMRSRKMTPTILSELSKEFGVGVGVVRDALNGNTFGHLPGAVKVTRQKSESTKLSVEQIVEIKRELLNPYWGQVSHLAAKYGVDHSEISHIKSGYTHSNITLD